jgi:CxxC motif-containing protein (DUF1111 family)
MNPTVTTRSMLAAVALALALAPSVGAAPGDPLSDLSPAHVGWFVDGRDAFEKVYSPADGLGPTFNAPSCVACHSTPVAGGGSNLTVTRFGRMTDGVFDPLIARGGPLLQAQAIDPACLETIPPEANVVTERLTTPMFGAGLVEAILDEDIARRADPDDGNHDGISGRVHLVPYPGRLRVGRFGWKAQEATLLSFIADAMVGEMGVTNLLVPNGTKPNGSAALQATCEAIEGHDDPEDVPAEGEFTDLVKTSNFARLLAAPSTAKPRGRGFSAFRAARCERCHVAAMRTGPHTIPALSEQRIYPFSDFLLHDMGMLGDGIVDGDAGPTEMRTAPLWGIAGRTRYLHDGRAATLRDAILAHDGEGAKSRERFLELSVRRQTDLVAFVASR